MKIVNHGYQMKITKEQQKQLHKIGKKHQLELMILFGSQAAGKTHQMSDFDIGILKKTDLTTDEYCDLLSDLCKFFKVKEDRIDISELKNASSLLLKGAADNGLVLYQKSPASFIEFYLKAYKQYIDEREIYELEKEYLENRYLKGKTYAQ